MSRGKWKGRWFMVYDNFDEVDENGNPKFWTGGIDNDEFGAWIRLMALASRGRRKGFVQIDHGVPYTEEQLNRVLKTDKPYIKKWTEQGAITNTDGIIKIANWKYWQNEQDRKDGYSKNPVTIEPATGEQARVDTAATVPVKIKRPKKERALMPTDEAAPIIADMIDCWNKLPGVRKCAKLTPKREEEMRAMLADEYYRANWKEGMRKFFRSDWLTKRKRRAEGDDWTADIDWFMRKDGRKSASLLLIMEGKYDNETMGRR